MAAKTKSGKPGESGPLTVAQVAGIGAVVFAVVFALQTQSSFLSIFPRTTSTTPTGHKISCDVGSWSLEHLKLTPVERIKWEPHLPFSVQVASWRRPVILTNTVVTQWKAMKRWQDDKYFRRFEHMKHLNKTWIGDDCQFMAADSTPLKAVPGVDSQTNFATRPMPLDEFLQRYDDPSEEKYYYWYGLIEGELKRDVEPNDFIWITERDLLSFGEFMWLSGPDIGPWLHYDQDHNFFVQIFGTKRFVMFPPWETSKIYPFPVTHPHWHKSQVNFDKPNLTKTPNFQNTSGLLAELYPGDVLYVPPYYWHHVRSHERSISLASWSQSGVFRKLKYGLYERKLWIDKIDTSQNAERLSGLRIFLEQLLETVYKEKAHQTYTEQLVANRWDPLGLALVDAEKLCAEAATVSAAHFGNHFAADIEFAIQSFENCQTKVDDMEHGIGMHRKDMQAIHDIELFEFIEFLVAEYIAPEKNYAFLKKCMFST